MIRIIVVDDHPIIRKGIIQILEDLPGENYIEDVSNSNELFQKLRELSFNLIILDISMPGRSGIDLLPDLIQLYPEIPVLILSMYPEEQYAIRAIKSGAAGYLTKESAPNELLMAVKKVISGGKYITSSLGEKWLKTYLLRMIGPCISSCPTENTLCSVKLLKVKA